MVICASLGKHQRGLRWKGGDRAGPRELTDHTFCAGEGALGVDRFKMSVWRCLPCFASQVSPTRATFHQEGWTHWGFLLLVTPAAAFRL